ncbi:MAG: hypothetical protein KC592_19245, partial [Nitrospira sp.]|nr:hypothetical protein [Nitrospira sp.]
DVILKFAESIDSHKTKLLSSSSSTKNKNLNIERSQDELQEMIDFIERIIGKIAVSPPLVPKPTPEIPEDYTNVEHIRMLEAVKGVMKEVKRIGKPLKAWIE